MAVLRDFKIKSFDDLDKFLRFSPFNEDLFFGNIIFCISGEKCQSAFQN